MTQALYDTLGKTVRRKRQGASMTQKQLAAAIGKSTSFLGHCERGTRKMSLETFLDIVIALRVTPNDLLDGVVPDDISSRWKKNRLEALADSLAKSENSIDIVSDALDALKNATIMLSLVREVTRLNERTGTEV